MSRWGMQIRRLPEELKIKIVTSILRDFSSVAAGCKYYELTETCCRSWRNKYKRQIAARKKELGRRELLPYDRVHDLKVPNKTRH